MVVRYSAATYRPLAPTQGQPRMARHDIICLHTMVGNLTSTDGMFHKNGWGGTESHFGVGGKWGPDARNGYDGRVFQWQDTEFSADANFQGNHRVISIETADNAPSLAKDIEAWTPKQLDAIVILVAYLCKRYDIPPVLVPDSKPTRRGIAYHRQGCEHSRGVGKVPGFLVAGGERWSTSKGKECPGERRIEQLQAIVIPRVRVLLAPKPKPPAPPAPEDEMNWTDEVALTETDAKIWTQHARATGSTATFTKGQKVKVSDMIRYPTLARKIHIELLELRASLAKPPAPPAP